MNKIHQCHQCSASEEIYDYLIVGSGFGGSVAAMRLSQKGYSVAVCEMGKRYRPEDFPKTNWNLRKYLWLPQLKFFGIQKISLLKNLLLLHGVGVGGGSLVYANTLMRPSSSIFQEPLWPKGPTAPPIDWEKELLPHYIEAERMLGKAKNPHLFPADEILKDLAQKWHISQTFKETEVGIYFGPSEGEEVDPYFAGEGPLRSGCRFCGGCMVGCRFKAKNTLDFNYLYFAEKLGTRIFPETKVTRIDKNATHYLVSTQKSTKLFRNEGPTFKAKNVILSAGVLGTLDILMKNKFYYKTLPLLSEQLGKNVRSNGEGLVGSTATANSSSKKNYSQGIAIGASIQVDAHTKIEAVRYPEGSDFMKLLAVPLTGNGSKWVRPLKLLGNYLRYFPAVCKNLFSSNWAHRSVILLIMKSIEQKMQLHWSPWWGVWGPQREHKGDSFMPLAQEAAKLISEKMQGMPQNIFSEVLLGSPATAHILGGACMGETDGEGVVNSHHEVFHYPGLFVSDASVIPCNLGVNPSLTITALAERFVAQIPKK